MTAPPCNAALTIVQRARPPPSKVDLAIPLKPRPADSCFGPRRDRRPQLDNPTLGG